LGSFNFKPSRIIRINAIKYAGLNPNFKKLKLKTDVAVKGMKKTRR
jgi:hypothetical protein